MCDRPLCQSSGWLRRVESNYSGLATSDLQSPPAPYRTTAQFWREGTDSNRRLSFVQCRVATARHVSRERSNRLSYPLVVFRLPFVKERRYYRIRNQESQGQKIRPAVCGRQGAPLWRNESGFLPITAKSVGVRRCVGLRRRLRWLDGRRHL